MKSMGVGVLIAAVAGVAISRSARSESSKTSEPAIHTEAVERFYRIYDAASGHPTADQLQHDYLDPGSDGLHQLAKLRNVSGADPKAFLAKSGWSPGMQLP